jgi:hypothetical protein
MSSRLIVSGLLAVAIPLLGASGAYGFADSMTVSAQGGTWYADICYSNPLVPPWLSQKCSSTAKPPQYHN